MKMSVDYIKAAFKECVMDDEYVTYLDYFFEKSGSISDERLDFENLMQVLVRRLTIDDNLHIDDYI